VAQPDRGEVHEAVLQAVARNAQHVLDQGAQPLRIADHDVQHLVDFGGTALLGALLDHVQIRHDGRQWGPQLMVHGGQKVSLCLVQLLELLDHLLLAADQVALDQPVRRVPGHVLDQAQLRARPFPRLVHRGDPDDAQG
jgi:hypothetical protein